MTATAFLVVFLATWLVVGLSTAWVMGRFGHDMFTWALLGTVFGPIIVPLAIDARRRARAGAGTASTHAVGGGGTGPVDVLVGVDGSAEATAALRTAVATLGPRIGRLALVYVARADRTPATAAQRELGTVALEQAARVARDTGGPDPDLLLITGRPGASLRALADAQDFDVIVVGPRGTGGTKLLLGSTAQDLIRTGGIPVLVAGAPASIALGRSDDVACEGQRDGGHPVVDVDHGSDGAVAEGDVDQRPVLGPVG